MRRPPIKGTIGKATMNAGTSINKPNAVRALVLGSLLVAVVAATAEDKPTPAVLRRSPDGIGVTAKSIRSTRIVDSPSVENAPSQVADENVVPASDTSGVNRVRIRAVEPPANGVPGIPRRTTSTASSPRPATTSTPATANITSDDTTPRQQPSAPQVGNRLPPLARAIGTPPPSAPLRTTTTAPARTTTPATARNATSAPPQAGVASTNASTQDAPASTAGVKKPSSRNTAAKTAAAKDNSGPIARGLAYFDPTKIMPWMRQNEPVEHDSEPTAEAESVVIDQGSTTASSQSASAPQHSPKPKVAQKAKKRSSKTAKPAEVATSEEGSTSGTSSFLNPLKSVRQIWSGTEPSTPKAYRMAKAKEPVAEQPADDAGQEQVAAREKPSMFAQLFGRGRSSEKVRVIKKAKNAAPPPEDSDVEIDSSEASDEVAIDRAPKSVADRSDDEVTEVPETFEAPVRPARPVASLPIARPPVEPRAANARLGLPVIELADEEVASTESDGVLR